MLADRNIVESEADSIYASAKEEDVAFLVVGDPLCATTHTDLIIRARELGIQVTKEICQYFFESALDTFLLERAETFAPIKDPVGQFIPKDSIPWPALVPEDVAPRDSQRGHFTLSHSS